MALRRILIASLIVLGVRGNPPRAAAQEIEDQSIDAIRKLETISPNDHQRIADWVTLQLKKLATTPDADRPMEGSKFRQRFKSQYDHKDNTPQFKAQLAMQTTGVAATQFADPKPDRTAAIAMSRALLDMERIETLPGLLAGLKSAQPAARAMCARGIEKIKSAIAAEKDKLDQTIAALKEAGASETDPFIVERIYSAFPNAAPPGPVVDAILAIFEKRVAARRQSPVADGADLPAFEFLRNPAILGALSPEQKSQLAKTVATFLRLDAERYGAAELSFDEIDRLERSLDAEEDILSQLVPGKGGKIRDAMAVAGHDSRADVLNQVKLWIGDAKTNEAGAVNGPPLSVPIGAP